MSAMQSDIGQYGIMPVWVLKSGVSSTAIRLYAVLAAQYADKEGACYPGRHRLAGDIGAGTNTVDRAIRELVEAGALAVLPRRTDDGGQATNLYHVRFSRPDCGIGVGTGGRMDEARGSPTDGQGGSSTDGAQTRSSINQIQFNQTLSNESDARELKPQKTTITTGFKERMRSTYGPGLADFEEAWAFHLDSSYLRKKLDKQSYMEGRLVAAVKREADRGNHNGNRTGGRRNGAPDAEVHDRSAYGTEALRLRPNFVEG